MAKLNNIDKKIKEIADSMKRYREEVEKTEVYNRTNQKILERRLKQQQESLENLLEENGLLNQKQDLLDHLTTINDKAIKAGKIRLHQEKEINRTLGITGGLFRGIEKSLGKIGVESSAFETMNHNMREMAKTGKPLKVMFQGIKDSAKVLGQSLDDPVVQFGYLGKLVSSTMSVLKEYGKPLMDIQTQLGYGFKEAERLYHSIDQQAEATKGIFSLHTELIAQQVMLTKSSGLNHEYTVKQLDNVTRLVQLAGLSNEEAAKMQEYSDLTGVSTEDIYDNIAGSNKSLINNNKVMKETMKVSGRLRLNYKASPHLISQAVIQANKLGMTLEQAAKASESLLNFESSIESELKAELLTGMNLNLEKARYLALQGKSAEAAEEMMKNLGPNGLQKFQRMNVLQQKALAESMGMSADELSESLIKQKRYNDLGSVAKKQLKDKVEELKKQGKIEQANALEKRGLQGDNVELAAKELDAAAATAKEFKKAKEELMKGMLPIVKKVGHALQEVTKFVQNNPWIKTVLKAVGKGLAIGAALSGVGALVGLLKRAFTGGGLFSMFAKRGSIMNKMHVINHGGGMGGPGGFMDGGPGGGGGYGFGGPHGGRRNKRGRNKNRRNKRRGGKRRGGRGGRGRMLMNLAGIGLGGTLFASEMGLFGDDPESGPTEAQAMTGYIAADMMSGMTGNQGTKAGSSSAKYVKQKKAADALKAEQAAAEAARARAASSASGGGKKKGGFSGWIQENISDPISSKVNSVKKTITSSSAYKATAKGLNTAKDFTVSAGKSINSALKDPVGTAKNIYKKGGELINKGKNYLNEKLVEPVANAIRKNTPKFLTAIFKSQGAQTLKKMLKAGSRALGPMVDILFGAMDVNTALTDYKEGGFEPPFTRSDLNSELGSIIISTMTRMIGGMLAGAGASAIPVVGPFLAPFAYMGGDYLGAMLGNAISDHIGGPTVGKYLADFLVGKGGGEKAMFAGGVVTGPTRALIGESGTEMVVPLNQFYAKIDKLIQAVENNNNTSTSNPENVIRLELDGANLIDRLAIAR